MLQDILSPAIQDIGRRHVAECLVVTAVVVIVDEVGNCLFQLAGLFFIKMHRQKQM